MKKKIKRLRYNGTLIYGSTSAGDPRRWHVYGTPTAGGDFTARGVAAEQIEDESGFDFGSMPEKVGGICTCAECIEQLILWKEVIEKAPKLREMKGAEAECNRFREALQEIKHVPRRAEGGMYDSDGDWYVNECSSCRRMHDIAREALKGAGE